MASLLNGSAGRVSSWTARNLRLQVGVVRVEVKGEIGDKFPKKVGLKHDEPNARNVLHFYGRMLRCTRSDLDRSVHL